MNKGRLRKTKKQPIQDNKELSMQPSLARNKKGQHTLLKKDNKLQTAFTKPSNLLESEVIVPEPEDKQKKVFSSNEYANPKDIVCASKWGKRMRKQVQSSSEGNSGSSFGCKKETKFSPSMWGRKKFLPRNLSPEDNGSMHNTYKGSDVESDQSTPSKWGKIKKKLTRRSRHSSTSSLAESLPDESPLQKTGVEAAAGHCSSSNRNIPKLVARSKGS